MGNTPENLTTSSLKANLMNLLKVSLRSSLKKFVKLTSAVNISLYYSLLSPAILILSSLSRNVSSRLHV